MSTEHQATGIAVFDFDGTLTRRDSFLAFIQFTHGTWALFWGLLLHTISILRYFVGHLTNDQLKEQLFTYFYQGYSATELQEQGRLFGQQVIPQLLYPGALQKLAWHRSQGHQIIILSASARLWLGPWCQEQGYKLISTEFTIEGDHYTGQLATANCYGKEKERRILPVLQDFPPNRRYSYGDRSSDHHFIRHCAHRSYLPLHAGLTPYCYQSHHYWSPLLYRLLHTLFAVLFLLLPFSLGIDFNTYQINIPTEPVIGLIALSSTVWFVLHRTSPLTTHRGPLLWASLFLLLALFSSTLTSTLPLVSVKYIFIAIVHWWVFFFVFPLLLSRSISSQLRLPLLYGISFLIILCYAWYNHAQYSFRIDVSVLTARPFYFDHALYSCCALLLLGPFISLFISSRASYSRLLFLVASVMLLAGLYLSFSRAAWLSFIAAGLLITIIVVFKLRFKHLLLLGLLGVITLFYGQSFLLQKLSQNSTPSKTESQTEHLRSSLNITSDASNLERLNRYRCAVRMFLDRPHLGFGPGTYQFAYLPYQQASEMTHISVTAAGRHRPGKGGGAHSEYLQSLSESGWPGLLSWLLLLVATFYVGLHLYHIGTHSFQRTLSIGLLFSLSTFFVHGVVNNFLHHGKVAALFWGLLAILHFNYSRP